MRELIIEGSACVETLKSHLLSSMFSVLGEIDRASVFDVMELVGGQYGYIRLYISLEDIQARN